MDHERKELREQAATSKASEDRTEEEGERLLEDDGRGWCGVRTYITGPQAIRSGKSAEFKSNYHVDLDPGCKSGHIDEVVWTISDVPPAYQGLIHIQRQDADSCTVAVEAGVPSGAHFTLHAAPSAHAAGRGAGARIACQINKSDAQVISIL